MKKICKHCLQEVDERYRRNQVGDVFCDDDCYDNYYEINDIECDDYSHPYIDDYEGIRSNYLDWLENWENDLNKLSHHENLQHEVDKMLIPLMKFTMRIGTTIRLKAMTEFLPGRFICTY